MKRLLILIHIFLSLFPHCSFINVLNIPPTLYVYLSRRRTLESSRFTVDVGGASMLLLDLIVIS